MNRAKVFDYLRAPLYIASLAALPFIIGYGRMAVERWTAPPMERCLRGIPPREFSDQDQRALAVLFRIYDVGAENLKERQSTEAASLSERMVGAEPKAQLALLDMLRAEHQKQRESLAQLRTRVFARECSAAAERSAVR